MTTYIYDQLKRIKVKRYEPDCGICEPDCGICGNLSFGSYTSERRDVEKAISEWPDAKGNPGDGFSYPVEGRREGYWASKAAGTLWDNPRRLALLDYLIEYFKP